MTDLQSSHCLLDVRWCLHRGGALAEIMEVERRRAESDLKVRTPSWPLSSCTMYDVAPLRSFLRHLAPRALWIPQKKEKEMPALENWLTEGIVVKVMSKALREKGHYKAKGVVLRVIDTFVAEVRMLESGVKVRVDQAELETVIPVRLTLSLLAWSHRQHPMCTLASQPNAECGACNALSPAASWLVPLLARRIAHCVSLDFPSPSSTLLLL